jgi:hypothetical protein
LFSLGGFLAFRRVTADSSKNLPPSLARPALVVKRGQAHSTVRRSAPIGQGSRPNSSSGDLSQSFGFRLENVAENVDELGIIQARQACNGRAVMAHDVSFRCRRHRIPFYETLGLVFWWSDHSYPAYCGGSGRIGRFFQSELRRESLAKIDIFIS